MKPGVVFLGIGGEINPEILRAIARIEQERGVTFHVDVEGARALAPIEHLAMLDSDVLSRPVDMPPELRLGGATRQDRRAARAEERRRQKKARRAASR